MYQMVQEGVPWPSVMIINGPTLLLHYWTLALENSEVTILNMLGAVENTLAQP